MMMVSIKKVLLGIIIAISLIVYTAPIGFCVVHNPKIEAMVSKPILRASEKPTFLKLEGDLALTKSNPKISLSLRNSDVQQVLRMFADKAGLNIVFHSSVSGNVTLDLVNVPLNEAFKLVMQITDLTYYLDNNTMVVASASVAQGLNLAKQELMIIPVKYVDAGILADFLNKNIFSINKPGLSNSQIAVTNPTENEILIFGTKNDYLMAQKIITQFDVKPRDEIFVVNHTTPKEMSDMICTVLFKDSGTTSTSSATTATSGSSSPSTPAPVSPASVVPSMPGLQNLPGLSNIPGVSTGGATDVLSLGEGIIACQFSNPVNAGTLSSLNTTSLTVTYYSQRGTIDVRGGSAQQMDSVKEFIASNDKKEPQAYLEISIIELSESGSREFNNNWQVWSKYFSGTFDGKTATNPLYPNFLQQGQSYNVLDSASTTDPYKVLYSVLPYSGTPTIAYTMNYLIKNGKGRVLANPRIMITNGETSKIDLSSDYIQQVTSQVLAGGSGGLAGGIQKTYTIGSDEGIVVDMVPFISPDGYVTLNINPKYSTIKEKVTEHNIATNTDDLVATLLQRRNLDLKNIRIKDGETLVIGGMIREDEQKTVAKIPVLGDLPGIGMFFRNTSTTKTKEELVIMITPKIIKESEDLVNSAGNNL